MFLINMTFKRNLDLLSERTNWSLKVQLELTFFFATRISSLCSAVIITVIITIENKLKTVKLVRLFLPMQEFKCNEIVALLNF